MSDAGRDPAASLGSHGPPVSYGVFYADGKLHSSWGTKAKAQDTAFTMRKFDHPGVYVSPLWLPEPPTNEERRAIVRALCVVEGKDAETLGGLLERTK
jgi:hypothetical protein